MRISDWSSDVCSSDLRHNERRERGHGDRNRNRRGDRRQEGADGRSDDTQATAAPKPRRQPSAQDSGAQAGQSRSSAPTTANGSTQTVENGENGRSEEHTSELQSLMRISYAVFCLKKKTKQR